MSQYAEKEKAPEASTYQYSQVLTPINCNQLPPPLNQKRDRPLNEQPF